MAVELQRNMSRQPSRESNNGSMNSYNSEGRCVSLCFISILSNLAYVYIYAGLECFFYTVLHCIGEALFQTSVILYIP